MARTIIGDHQRYVKSYFSAYPGYYFSGDGARRDADSYYWITGRVDDCMNVSGHLLSTAEIEAAILLHPGVVEAAVVSTSHRSKGQAPYAFVVLSNVSQIIIIFTSLGEQNDRLANTRDKADGPRKDRSYCRTRNCPKG